MSDDEENDSRCSFNHSMDALLYQTEDLSLAPQNIRKAPDLCEYDSTENHWERKTECFSRSNSSFASCKICSVSLHLFVVFVVFLLFCDAPVVVSEDYQVNAHYNTDDWVNSNETYNEYSNQTANETANDVNSYGSFGNASDDSVAYDDMIYYANPYGSLTPYASMYMMPVQCIELSSGHFIKFDLFGENESARRQCKTASSGSYVVSVERYMRAYFNYQALLLGSSFQLPRDAGFLSCLMIQSTVYSNSPLYAKVGCSMRGSRSTELQLHVYTDYKCTQKYDDGMENARGYNFNGYWYSNKVSFNPQFLSCKSCSPEEISNSFQYSSWYVDDTIDWTRDDQNNSQGGGEVYADDQIGQNYTAGDDDTASSYANSNAYEAAATHSPTKFPTMSPSQSPEVVSISPTPQPYPTPAPTPKATKYRNDDFYGFNDDDGRRMLLSTAEITSLPVRTLDAAPGDHEKYENQFWEDFHFLRSLAQGDNQYGFGDWNMCQRLHYYGASCDAECQALSYYSTEKWSKADLGLLVTICVFMLLMMLFIFAKRVRAYETALIYESDDDAPYPGLPPTALAFVFASLLATIAVLANLRLVNETLVFSVVICVLIFMYMLKLTLFDNPRLYRRQAPTVAYDTMSRQLFDAGV